MVLLSFVRMLRKAAGSTSPFYQLYSPPRVLRFVSTVFAKRPGLFTGGAITRVRTCLAFIFAIKTATQRCTLSAVERVAYVCSSEETFVVLHDASAVQIATPMKARTRGTRRGALSRLNDLRLYIVPSRYFKIFTQRDISRPRNTLPPPHACTRLRTPRINTRTHARMCVVG